MRINFLYNNFYKPSFSSAGEFQNSDKIVQNEDKSVYVINLNGKYVKLPSYQEAVLYIKNEKLKDANPFLAENKKFIIKGAKDIEDKNGVVDRAKLKYFIGETTTMPGSKRHCGGEKPISIYAIAQNGEYKKYESLVEFAKDINTKRQNVSYSLAKNHRIYGLIIKRASEIEDKNGFVKKEKIEYLIKNPPRRGGQEKSVYFISPEGEIKKFKSIKSMAEFLECNPTKISEVLGKRKKYKGYIIEFAKLLENKDGEIDNQKVQELIKLYKEKESLPVRRKRRSKEGIKTNISNNSKNEKNAKVPTPIYVVNLKTGHAIKLPSKEKAAEIFGIDINSIGYFLQNPRLALRHFRFTNSFNIENENGEIDNAKVKKLLTL